MSRFHLFSQNEFYIHTLLQTIFRKVERNDGKERERQTYAVDLRQTILFGSLITRVLIISGHKKTFLSNCKHRILGMLNAYAHL